MKPFKVVCIDDSEDNDGAPGSGWVIKKGTIYTVGWQGPIKGTDGTFEPGYALVEDPDFSTMGYAVYHFRRLDEYTDATSEILRGFNPDQKEQEIFNPVKEPAAV